MAAPLRRHGSAATAPAVRCLARALCIGSTVLSVTALGDTWPSTSCGSMSSGHVCTTASTDGRAWSTGTWTWSFALPSWTTAQNPVVLLLSPTFGFCGVTGSLTYAPARSTLSSGNAVFSGAGVGPASITDVWSSTTFLFTATVQAAGTTVSLTDAAAAAWDGVGVSMVGSNVPATASSSLFVFNLPAASAGAFTLSLRFANTAGKGLIKFYDEIVARPPACDASTITGISLNVVAPVCAAGTFQVGTSCTACPAFTFNQARFAVRRNNVSPCTACTCNPACETCAPTTGTCGQLPGFCAIAGVCYTDGQKNPGDLSLYCFAASSTTAWTVYPSSTPTPSVSPSTTSSTSVSASMTTSRTGTASVTSTSTGSWSITPTSSVSPTVSATLTSTSSLSASSTVSWSVSASPSVSSSFTPSTSVSASSSPSTSISGSITPSTSVTASISCSGTVSSSVTPSTSSSASVSTSKTASPSISASVTSSSSTSPSLTPSTSVTPSITASVTVSSSRTPSTSVSPTSTPSNSVSPSGTPSSSMSPSITPSQTVSSSVSRSGTISPSVTASTSVTATLTPSTSISPSTTPSITASSSVSPSVTCTGSVTPSTSASATKTPSVTSTGSVSPSTSISSSVSPTYGFTLSSSASASMTASSSASASMTASSSGSASVSESPSATASGTWSSVPNVIVGVNGSSAGNVSAAADTFEIAFSAGSMMGVTTLAIAALVAAIAALCCCIVFVGATRRYRRLRAHWEAAVAQASRALANEETVPGPHDQLAAAVTSALMRACAELAAAAPAPADGSKRDERGPHMSAALHGAGDIETLLLPVLTGAPITNVAVAMRGGIAGAAVARTSGAKAQRSSLASTLSAATLQAELQRRMQAHTLQLLLHVVGSERASEVAAVCTEIALTAARTHMQQVILDQDVERSTRSDTSARGAHGKVLSSAAEREGGSASARQLDRRGRRALDVSVRLALAAALQEGLHSGRFGLQAHATASSSGGDALSASDESLRSRACAVLGMPASQPRTMEGTLAIAAAAKQLTHVTPSAQAEQAASNMLAAVHGGNGSHTQHGDAVLELVACLADELWACDGVGHVQHAQYAPLTVDAVPRSSSSASRIAAVKQYEFARRKAEVSVARAASVMNAPEVVQHMLPAPAVATALTLAAAATAQTLRVTVAAEDVVPLQTATERSTAQRAIHLALARIIQRLTDAHVCEYAEPGDAAASGVAPASAGVRATSVRRHGTSDDITQVKAQMKAAAVKAMMAAPWRRAADLPPPTFRACIVEELSTWLPGTQQRDAAAELKRRRAAAEAADDFTVLRRQASAVGRRVAASRIKRVFEQSLPPSSSGEHAPRIEEHAPHLLLTPAARVTVTSSSLKQRSSMLQVLSGDSNETTGVERTDIVGLLNSNDTSARLLMGRRKSLASSAHALQSRRGRPHDALSGLLATAPPQAATGAPSAGRRPSINARRPSVTLQRPSMSQTRRPSVTMEAAGSSRAARRSAAVPTDLEDAMVASPLHAPHAAIHAAMTAASVARRKSVFRDAAAAPVRSTATAAVGRTQKHELMEFRARGLDSKGSSMLSTTGIYQARGGRTAPLPPGIAGRHRPSVLGGRRRSPSVHMLVKGTDEPEGEDNAVAVRQHVVSPLRRPSFLTAIHDMDR